MGNNVRLANCTPEVKKHQEAMMEAKKIGDSVGMARHTKCMQETYKANNCSPFTSLGMVFLQVRIPRPQLLSAVFNALQIFPLSLGILILYWFVGTSIHVILLWAASSCESSHPSNGEWWGVMVLRFDCT